MGQNRTFFTQEFLSPKVYIEFRFCKKHNNCYHMGHHIYFCQNSINTLHASKIHFYEMLKNFRFAPPRGHYGTWGEAIRNHRFSLPLEIVELL